MKTTLFDKNGTLIPEDAELRLSPEQLVPFIELAIAQLAREGSDVHLDLAA